MRVSIVIRTKNDGSTLRRVLELYSSQTLTPFELILADNGSTDGTLRIAKEYNCKILPIVSHPYNHAYACNKSMQFAKGDIVVLANGHTIPISKTWLKDGTAHFSNKKVAGVSGNVLPDFERSTSWEKKRFELFSRFLQSPQIRIYRRLRFWNFGMFYTYAGALRKDLWEKVSFDEVYSQKRGMGEDVLWSFDLISKGYTFIVDPKFSVFHSHSENLSQLLHSQYVYGKNYLHTYFTYIRNKHHAVYN